MMTRQRSVRVLVTTTVEYLTANGEETEESGWNEIKDNLARHLQRFNLYQQPTRPSADFDEWMEE
jgi:tRNA-dihydrouridine synthase